MIDKRTIDIPTEIKLKTEFFEGYGTKELIQTIVVGAISGVFSYIVYLATHKTLLSTFIVIGTIVVAVISLIKGQNNFSMVDSIKNLVKYMLMQKEYRYSRGGKNFKTIRSNNKQKK